MLVVTAVSSIKRGGPDQESLAPESSVGARAMSARFRSAARRLFFASS